MSKKLAETRKQGWLTLLALVTIAIVVYIGFTPLFNLINGGIAGHIVGSSFGAIFVIILTMFGAIRKLKSRNNLKKVKEFLMSRSEYINKY